jgi:Domain of unknown function (DUF4145)
VSRTERTSRNYPRHKGTVRRGAQLLQRGFVYVRCTSVPQTPNAWAVAQGAPENQTFMAYVEHLAASGYVPPHGKGWVDHIRKKGNEANHEIVLMEKDDAQELISFVEMLLKFIYEFPSRIPSSGS